MEVELTVIRAGLERLRLGGAAGEPDTLASRDAARLLLDDEEPFVSGTLARLRDDHGISVPRQHDERERLEMQRALRTRLDRVPLLRAPIDARLVATADVEIETGESSREDLEWIEIQLVDEDDQPVAGVAYRIELSDRRVRTGVTNAHGVIRYDRIPGGTCKFTFTELDEQVWEPL